MSTTMANLTQAFLESLDDGGAVLAERHALRSDRPAAA